MDLKDYRSNKIKFKDLEVGGIYLVLEGLDDDNEKNKKIRIIEKVVDKRVCNWIKYEFLDETKINHSKEYEVGMYFTPDINEELSLVNITTVINVCGEVVKENDDMVNHPKHYNKGKYEVIDVIEDWGLGFNLGNTIKYIARCNHKSNKKQDLEKAIFYLKRELERER